MLRLKQTSLLTLHDLSNQEMLQLIELACELKEKKKNQGGSQLLRNKNIAMIFEKSSTRTRCATMVAAADEGASVEYLGKDDIHLGKKESVADTARVLGRMFDGIMFRGFQHKRVQQLTEWAGIPVWNGLTDDAHPTQILADLMTVKENLGELKGCKVVYLGDGRNNVCNSLMLGCAKTGMHFVNCCPPELSPNEKYVETSRQVANETDGEIEIVHQPEEAVEGANVIYTDVWASMGEEKKFEERRHLLQDYQVNLPLVRKSGNFENGRLIFLHCLPAFHNKDTEYTRQIGALEVTNEVFESEVSKVFDEAENRMHTIKALMLSTLL
ncbi:MAG: ornithine carbamoyltransferase [Verrucomicrobiota bacterium]